MKKFAVLLACAVVAAAASPSQGMPLGSSSSPAPAESGGDGVFLNILPPGQGTSATTADAVRFFASGDRPPHTDDQVGMYSSLVTAPKLDREDLLRFFKPETLIVGKREGVTEPRDDVRIFRDTFGVPHVYGDSRAAAMFGAGYATAVDRMFMIDVLRHVGKGRMSEFLGPTPANLAMDRDSYLVAGYTDQERRAQVRRLARFGAPGRQVTADVRSYVAGINARIQEVIEDPDQMPAEYPALQLEPEPWDVTDVVAIATLIQGVFAAGGGGELVNANFIQQARERLGNQAAKGLWRDLRHQEVPNAPVTTSRRFPYMATRVVDRGAVAMPDANSIQPFDPISTTSGEGSGFGPAVVTAAALQSPSDRLREALGRLGLSFPGAMSNFLAVTRQHSATGHPIAVMGPQTSYFSPEILMEIHIHAPGVNARGAAFPGLSLYVLLGRGKDFAWSATSGGSDLVDVRAERLCEPDGTEPTLDSDHYLFRGECLAMYQRTDSWVAKPSAGGPGEPQRVEARVVRTVHGPVVARGTVEGAPVAFASQRSTFKGELDSAPAFVLLNNNRVTGPDSFARAMNLVTGTFNWLYVDDRHVSFFHSGKYPQRAPGVNPNLPSWGTGRWEWQGFMPRRKHPQETDPAKGWITSWNNKPARSWRAADGNWSYSTVYRSEMLDRRLKRSVATGSVSVVEMVDIMRQAATTDLRGQEVLPPILKLMRAHGSTEVRPYVRLLERWVARGAHRLDRDGDGQYDDSPAVALMDSWWPRLINGIFRPQLKGLFEAVPTPFDDPNRVHGLGSAFQNGWYGTVQKSVLMALGKHVPQPYRELRCGRGTAATCAAALERSLLAAAGRLGAEPESWDANEARDQIEFTAVGLITVDPIPWQNRPTFQQVVSVSVHRPRG